MDSSSIVGLVASNHCMFTIALFGAGKIGEAITALLSISGRYKVRICDQGLESAKAIADSWPQAEAHALDLSNEKSCLELLKGTDAVLSALPFHCNPQVAALAKKANVHYLDLTEDVETTKAVSLLAQSASSAFIPQCGLAPGFISIVAAHLVSKFDVVDTVKMRVGALPLHPSNRLKYNLTWSTEGLINEYINMCEMIEDGEKKLAPAMESYERFVLDGDEYEAFHTSGGLGTLCDTLLGKVRKLNYKSIRFPGHRDLMSFLLDDLKFRQDRAGLKTILERSISTTAQDMCVVFVSVEGQSKKKFVQKTYASKIYNRIIKERHFGAIQITTASGICAPLDLLLTGKLPRNKGMIKTEEIPLKLFLDNEFGANYKDDKALTSITT